MSPPTPTLETACPQSPAVDGHSHPHPHSATDTDTDTTLRNMLAQGSNPNNNNNNNNSNINNNNSNHSEAIKELWEEYTKINSVNRHLGSSSPILDFATTSSKGRQYTSIRSSQVVVIPKRSASLANVEIMIPLSTPSAKRTFSLPNHRHRSPRHPDEVSDLIDLYNSI
ncbi:hypothetical protein BJ741DRAFT_593599 [Chytriomyces cf. hyalinus JEL632]|nr:hypothetical protein BJ741DRAFT_593599 [Chytriomyces cf. hyalinus JEL632]